MCALLTANPEGAAPAVARGRPALAASIAAALALTVASGNRGLGDTDPYRHLAYAHALWVSRFTLRGHPFLPFTILGHSGVDLWWGFHLLMIPFSALGILWGARAAGAAIAAFQAGSLAWLFQKLGNRWGWIFALLPLLLSSSYLNRDRLARPAHLTVPLAIIELCCGAGLLGPWVAGLCAFAYGLLHLSSPLAVAFCGLGLVCARLGGTRTTDRSLLYAIGGLALSFLARPDRANYLTIAIITNLDALGIGSPELAEHGGELGPASFHHFAWQFGPVLIVVIASLVLGRHRGRAGARATRISAAAATIITAVLCFRSQRFLDYAVPLGCMTAAAFWPRELPRFRFRPGLAVVAALVAVAFLVKGIRYGWAIGDAFLAPPSSFEKMAAIIRANVPPGSVIVTDDLIEPSILWSYLPEYRFICAYEPAILYAAHPHMYWRWEHAITEGIACDDPKCRPAEPSGESIAKMVESFGSAWMFSFYTRPKFSILPVMYYDRARFTLIGTAPAPVGRLSVWHVNPRPKKGKLGD